MSNTSDPTTQPSKTRLIVGEIGVDTETGIIGKGHSYDNGKTFVVDDTIYGRVYHADDHGKIWKGIQDQVAKVVAPARAAADSAVSAADAAVASAQVTSDAVTAIANATAEAKQGANEAMSRAESAWDVATGAKEAVTDFDPLLKSAQSDASMALTQIADTASALSDAKTEFGSDVAEAKQLANTAQTTANSAVESAGENARALTSQANALSDAKKAIDSDVASAKGLANAAQATADNAIKSASSVANDLSVVASQAKANANGITKVTSDVGLLQTTVANNTGDISTIQETAKQIQQAVSDNAGNITVAKQTADSAATVASDAKSNATVAVQTASGASVTAKNAQGDATTAKVTAQDAVTQASDAKSNATIAVQTASEASLTAANAQGDASIAKQTASDASVQIKNAQGDISKLQTRAGAIETSVANNSGAIADVQATANQLKASVSDNAGNITVAKQTADSAVTVASDAKSNATVAIQTASQASITASNASGQAASAVLTANGAMTTASDAKSDATVAVQTASGASLTATNAQGDATIAKQTASEAKVQASNAESDFAQLSVRANKIEANVSNNSGAIASVKQTADGLTTSVSSISDQLKASGHKVKVQSSTFNTSANYSDAGVWLDGTRVGSIGGGIKFTMGTLNLDWSGYTQKDYATTSSLVSDLLALQDKIVVIYMADAIPPYGSDLVNALAKMGGDSKLATTTSVSFIRSPFIFIGMSLDTNGNQVLQEGEGYLNAGIGGDGQVKYAWGYEGDSNKILTSSTIGKVTEIKTTVDGINTTISDPKTGLNATYQTAQGNATTISNVKGDVSQLQATANGLTSRVGNLESKTNTQQTTIDQNKAAIALKADQTTVDTLKGTVNQNTATLNTQASQIQAKVSASDVSGMLTGYATQNYTQSLVTQKANDWNLNLTSLKTDMNAIKTTGGGVNLLQGTGTASGDVANGNGTFAQGAFNGYDAVKTNGAWRGRCINLQSALGRTDAKAGDWYTISVYVKADKQIDTGSLDVYRALGNGDAYTNDGYLDSISMQDKPITTQWKQYAWSFQINNISLQRQVTRIEYNNDTGDNWIYWGGWMLEKGTVAHDWSPAPSDMATVTSVTNLSATVDGIQAQVYNSDGSSKITQLSNVIATKVSQGDYNSQITQLKNDINLRVAKGDVISQINQEAGGDTLIQVSNGKKSLILDAGNTIITGKAWIPSAAIANLTADQIQAGTLSGSKVHAGDNSGNAIDMGVISADYVGFHAYAKNGDNTYIDLNGIHNYGASYDTRIQQGKITTNYLTVNGGGMIDFRDSNGTGMIAEGSTLTFDVGNTPAGYLSYSGMPVAELPDGLGGNELTIRYGLSASIIPNDNSGAQATFSNAAQKIAYMTWTSQGKQMLSGLEIHSDNHHWFGAVNSDATYNRIEINSNDGLNLTWHDNTHFLVSDGKAKLYKDYNDGQTATELEVHGWAWVNGWVEAAGHSQHSTLSSKARIEKADPDYMLDLVNNTDLTTFAFKSELAEGIEIKHIGPIIDDVNDVAQYRTPAEFIAPTKKARDDDNMIGALFGAVQALTKRIKTLEEKTK